MHYMNLDLETHTIVYRLLNLEFKHEKQLSPDQSKIYTRLLPSLVPASQDIG